MEPNNLKPVYTIASLSGGKDSTAMLLRLLEEARPIDEILFCDTGWEFPQMYDHLARLERYIGRPITRLKAPLTAEQYFYEYTANPDGNTSTSIQPTPMPSWSRTGASAGLPIPAAGVPGA